MSKRIKQVDLYSHEIERICLSSLINYSKDCVDFLPHIDENHFVEDVHSSMFLVLKNLVLAGEHIDITILADKMTSLGIKFIEDIHIFDYIKSLKHFNSVNQESIPEYFKSLHKYFNARELESTAIKISSFVKENIKDSSQQLIAGVEKIFAEKINHYSSDADPKDLFKDLMEEIELLGNSPQEDGVNCPYESLRKYFGNFLNGGLYIFAAPAKNGKSTLLMDILRKTCKPQKVRGLYLDTELTTMEQRTRVVAAMSGVNEYYIRTGNFRRDKVMYNAVRETWPKVKSMEDSIDHLYVAGKPIDEITSLIRRWYYKNIHDGVKPIIIYDYIKLTGEKVSDSWKEYQVIGQKTDKLKQMAQELQCPIIAAIQTNAENDVAMSKQIKWFCNTLAMFRKKTPDELEFCGDKFGSHIMTITESRNQGEAALGFSDVVKLPDGKFKRFFLNFDLKNFNVEDRGTLLDVVELKQANFEMEEKNNKYADDIF